MNSKRILFLFIISCQLYGCNEKIISPHNFNFDFCKTCITVQDVIDYETKLGSKKITRLSEFDHLRIFDKQYTTRLDADTSFEDTKFNLYFIRKDTALNNFIVTCYEMSYTDSINTLPLNKIIIGIIIAIIVIGGGAFFLNKNNFSQTQMQNIPTQTQGQAPTSPTTGSTQATAGKNAVTIQNFAFSPETLTVKVGDKITWTNQDSAGHSATADDNSFDTGVIGQGQSGSITFSKAGTYTYHCSVHPMMKGTIVVQ